MPAGDGADAVLAAAYPPPEVMLARHDPAALDSGSAVRLDIAAADWGAE